MGKQIQRMGVAQVFQVSNSKYHPTTQMNI